MYLKLLKSNDVKNMYKEIWETRSFYDDSHGISISAYLTWYLDYKPKYTHYVELKVGEIKQCGIKYYAQNIIVENETIYPIGRLLTVLSTRLEAVKVEPYLLHYIDKNEYTFELILNAMKCDVKKTLVILNSRDKMPKDDTEYRTYLYAMDNGYLIQYIENPTLDDIYYALEHSPELLLDYKYTQILSQMEFEALLIRFPYMLHLVVQKNTHFKVTLEFLYALIETMPIYSNYLMELFPMFKDNLDEYLQVAVSEKVYKKMCE